MVISDQIKILQAIMKEVGDIEMDSNLNIRQIDGNGEKIIDIRVDNVNEIIEMLKNTQKPIT